MTDQNASPESSVPTAHRTPGDEEVVYFEGRPMLRADQAKAMFWLIIGLALLALPGAAWLYDWLWWKWWMTLAAIVLALIVIVTPWVLLRATRYRISNYRIDYERGILTKKIDTLELWHVDDITFEQGIIDRMCNVGSILIMSNDKTTPRLELHGVPNPRSIFDSLKQRVIAVKRQRGVIKMDVA
jgi:membrane protein YdbS with pleckstrin-like domain